MEIKQEEGEEREEEGRKRKLTFEEEVQALLADPTIKRRRSGAREARVEGAVVVDTKVKRPRKGRKGVKKEEEQVEVDVEIEAAVKREGEEEARLVDVKTEQVVVASDGVGSC